ncbi:MAG: hypothetical protein P4L44_12040 [Oryzomonas sp.]|nr:hypothetical protein [Oryzomonas sp.]MDR3580684.1 hypothetical protein [Oryzomonas sp.]
MPVQSFDKTIMSLLAERGFTPGKVTLIVREVKKYMEADGGGHGID